MSSNRLKSIFVTGYLLAVLLIGIGSVAGILLSDARVAWTGTLLSVLPFLVMFLQTTLYKSKARTSANLPIASMITLLGVGVAAYVFWRSRFTEALPFSAALVGAVGFFLYDFWYSRLGKRINESLSTGRTLPDFQAQDLEGNTVQASDLRGHTVLFMFYRGNWCPFCMAQVREITGKYRDLAEMGVELVLVSPQPTELTQRVAGMFNVPCRFWVDEGLGAAAALGIVHKDGVPAGSLSRNFGSDTVLPTVIIVDGEGRILFTDQTENYRLRPDPDDFLRVLQSHRT